MKIREELVCFIRFLFDKRGRCVFELWPLAVLFYFFFFFFNIGEGLLDVEENKREID